MSFYTAFAHLGKHYTVYGEKWHAACLNQMLDSAAIYFLLGERFASSVVSTRFYIYCSYIWFYSFVCLFFCWHSL